MSIRYGVGVLQTAVQYRLRRRRLRRYPYLDIDPAHTLTHADGADEMAEPVTEGSEPAEIAGSRPPQ